MDQQPADRHAIVLAPMKLYGPPRCGAPT
jgi:hypothetical protein